MKKILTTAVLGLVLLTLGQGRATAGFFCHSCCHDCCATICCRQYNAFTPCCFGTICCNGCCPVSCGQNCGPMCPPACGPCCPPSCGPDCCGSSCCGPDCGGGYYGQLPSAGAPTPPPAPGGQFQAPMPTPAVAPGATSHAMPQGPVQTSSYYGYPRNNYGYPGYNYGYGQVMPVGYNNNYGYGYGYNPYYYGAR